MAANFRIFFHRNSDNLHLKLSGDFDGSSAKQLIEFLTNRTERALKIFIHTSGLKQIHPFGKDILERHIISHNRKMNRIVFTGENW